MRIAMSLKTDNIKRQNKLFIWDFHGTLEKGNDSAVLEITNRALESSNLTRRMTAAEAELLAGKRWHEYFAFLLPELPHSAHLTLQSQCISISQKHPEITAKYIQINAHAIEVLETIKSSHHTQILVSNTQPHSLDQFLKAVQIEHFFPSTHRVGVDNHTQKDLTKKKWLTSFLMDNQYDGGIISIGDSPADIELIECHPKGVGYLYSYPERPHRNVTFKCHKITSLKDVLKEV